jgi:hypothetical protein
VTGDQRDVEARLRASLHAYADAVDDEQPPQRRPGSAGRQRPSALRGWRGSLLVAAAVLAVAGGTWVVADFRDAPSPTAASEDAAAVLGSGDSRAESAPESAAEQPPDSSAEAGAAFDAAVPLSELPQAEVGGEYPFDLYTHCGIFGADVGGVWFAAEPPLVEEAGPPAGWGDPYQRGTLTLESADEAVFRDDAGHEVRLRAAPDSERPPTCD